MKSKDTLFRVLMYISISFGFVLGIFTGVAILINPMIKYCFLTGILSALFFTLAGIFGSFSIKYQQERKKDQDFEKNNKKEVT